MDLHLRGAAIAGTLLLLLLVLELVRRRRLLERYALVWMAVTGAAHRAHAVGRPARRASRAVIGIGYPPSALFLIAFGFVILLLLHFSVAVSRLTDQSKVLAQQLSLLEERVRRQEERDALATEAAELERTEA